MKPWPTVRLGEVLTHYAEHIEVPEPQEYRKLSVKLHGKGVVLDSPADGATLKMKRHQLAKAGQVILSEIWGKKGAIGLVPPEGEGALCTSHFFLFDVREDKLHRGWLKAIFDANYLQGQLDAEAKGTTGYAAVRPKILLACEIPLPPLAQQRRVVARIEELAAQIHEARTLRHQAAEEAEALTSSAKSALSHPDSADEVSIGDLVGENGLRNGKSVKSTGLESEICCLTLSAMRNGRIDVRDSKPVPMSSAEAAPFQVRRGDVYVIRGNGSKGLCGRSGIIAEESPGVVFPDLFIQIALPRDRVLPEFFVAAWNSSATRTVIEEKAKTTSGIWKINQGHILSTRIPLPPLPEQRRIVSELDALQAEVEALKGLQAETAAELDALLPAPLHKAFKGEL